MAEKKPFIKICDMCSARGIVMHIRKCKKPKLKDLLTMPEVERMKLIREVRAQLRQRAAEAKLWHALMEADNVTIDGKLVQSDKMPLKGLSLSDIWNHSC